MIRNEHERRVTKAQLRKLDTALEVLDDSELPLVRDLSNEWAYELQKQGIESQADSLRRELDEYDALRSGDVHVLEAESWDELPDALIKVRIARGWTHRELAERLGVAEQQIQQYEASRYQSVSVARLGDIMNALDITVSETVYLKAPA